MENVKVNQIEIERQKISQIDEALVKLLDSRFKVVKAIAVTKKQLGMSIFQPGREQQVLQKTASLSQNPEFIQSIFQNIMQESRKFQENLK